LAAVGLAAAAGKVPAADEQVEDRESLEKALADGDSIWSAREPIVVPPWPEAAQSIEPQPVEEQPSDAQREDLPPEGPQSPQGDAPSLWAETPVGWDVQEPATLEEAPVEPETETIAMNPEAAGATEAAAKSEAAEAEDTGTPASTQDMTARLQASDDSLSSLHGRIRTADELMALQPEERADMLAFLEPSELSRVIGRSDERELKKSAIDVLENLGSPASLDVIRQCLDDPDQEIQLYALDAADRLLGDE
jgi:hypothetical protein